MTTPTTVVPSEATTPPDQASTAVELADLLDQAAALIERDGLHRGDYWPAGIALPYAAGQPVDVVGALAVAAGITDAAEIDEQVIGTYRYNPVRHAAEEGVPHPVITVLRKHLGLPDIEELFAWSDNHGAAEVIVELRVCAAKLRIGAGT